MTRILSAHQLNNFFELLSDQVIQNADKQNSTSTAAKSNISLLSNKELKNILSEISQISNSHFDIAENKFGFYNLGNTCFMNSALQCLYNLPEFCSIIDSRSWDFDKEVEVKFLDKSKNPPEISTKLDYQTEISAPINYSLRDVLLALKDTDKTLKKVNARAVNPKAILQQMARIDRAFYGGRQQDASEFLTTILDKLHEETKHPLLDDEEYKKILTPSCSDNLHGTQDQEPEMPNSENLTENSASNKVHKYVNYISPYSETFDGELTSTVKCLHCQNKSLTKEPFQILTLSIPYGPVQENVAEDKKLEEESPDRAESVNSLRTFVFKISGNFRSIFGQFYGQFFEEFFRLFFGKFLRLFFEPFS